jgi:hypothetical protein
MPAVSAGVAQLAERPSCKRQGSGSIPLTGSVRPALSALREFFVRPEHEKQQCRVSICGRPVRPLDKTVMGFA